MAKRNNRNAANAGSHARSTSASKHSSSKSPEKDSNSVAAAEKSESSSEEKQAEESAASPAEKPSEKAKDVQPSEGKQDESKDSSGDKEEEKEKDKEKPKSSKPRPSIKNAKRVGLSGKSEEKKESEEAQDDKAAKSDSDKSEDSTSATSAGDEPKHSSDNATEEDSLKEGESKSDDGSSEKSVFNPTVAISGIKDKLFKKSEPEEQEEPPERKSPALTVDQIQSYDVPKRVDTTYDNRNVFYMSGAALSRPLDMPSNVRRVAAIFCIIAALIGAGVLFVYFDNLINQPMREQKAVEERLDIAKKTPVVLPNLKILFTMTDPEIMASLNAEGGTYFERQPAGSGTEMEVVKLPAGMTVADAAALYLRGVQNLTGSEAVELLTGSWDLKVNREAGTNISLHYADFESASVDAAIQYALAAESFDNLEVDDRGTDHSGNTFVSGTLSISGKDYIWRVSATTLDQVYSINGLPKESFYVGIRIS